jgi:hypothetical protein
MPDIFVDKDDAPPQENQPQIAPETKNEENKNSDNRQQIVELQLHKDHAHSHFTTAYCEYPAGVVFADKLSDEVLLLFLRKHFVTNMPWVISAIGLLLAPLLLLFIVDFGLLTFDFLPSSYVTMFLVLYYFFIFGFLFVHYLTWFYNIGLVTNQRIIDIDFSSLVFENVDATKLSQVEDVGYKQVGIIRSIFDYGDIHLHTAGPTSNFEFFAVPHPEKIINIINNLIGKAKHA